MKIVTRESLQAMLDKDVNYAHRVIGRALVALYQHQTEEEKYCEEAHDSNDMGFNAFDAKVGSLHAKQYLKYGRISNEGVRLWLKKNKHGWSRLTKYHRQLNVIAVNKIENTQIS